MAARRPQIVTMLLKEYRDETDLFGSFFDDYCDHGPNLMYSEELYDISIGGPNTNHLQQVSKKPLR